MHVVQFGDEGKVTRDLSIIFDQEAFLLELPEFHILKRKLSDRKTREKLEVDLENIVAAIPLERVLKGRTSRLLKDTDGRKSFSILSMARTMSSNTLLWRSALTTLTCSPTINFLLIDAFQQ